MKMSQKFSSCVLVLKRQLKHFFVAVVTGVLSAGVIQTVWAQAAAEPAQYPMLNRSGGAVKPNVVLNIDESGSMLYQYMPETTATVGAFKLPFPIDRSLIMNPQDTRKFAGTFIGTVMSDPDNTTNVFQRQMRSPDVNTIYYNPDTRYLPWVLGDGSRMPNSTPTAAPLDAVGFSTTASVNLTSTSFTVNLDGANNGFRWCRDIDAARLMTCDTGSRKYAPGLVYRLKKDASGAFLNPATAGNFNVFNVNVLPSGGFPRHPSRTDCVASTTSCNLAEERQNFANWFTYYRARLLLAQAAIPEAFVDFGDNMRVGWGRIHQGYSNIDGANSATLVQGVRDFSAAHKTGLFNFLRNQNVFSGTPLRSALYGVGEYFTRSDNGGPYSDDPAARSTAAHKVCRRNFHLLVTDGYWSDTGAPFTAPLVGNSDNTNGAVITGPNSASGRYSASRPWRDGNSNTLADYAMHFWKNDLRSSTMGSPALTNNLRKTTDNQAFWQHMTNYTVGLGVTGALNPATDLQALIDGDKAWTSDKIDDLWHAALNSGGKAFSAKNTGELAGSIRSALNDVTQQELVEAGVATASAALEAGNRKYIPRYKTGIWTGDVEAFSLNADGATGVKVWTANSKLPAWNDRNIYTWDTGLSTPGGVEFKWPSLSTANRTAIQGTQSLVDYLRGDRSLEGSGFRTRDVLLGDFLNSNPVLVRRSSAVDYTQLPSIGTAFTSYLNTTKAGRDGMLYIGSNGGMLHAFKDTVGANPTADGVESFAYVPRAVYGSLSKLASTTYGTSANPHRFFVDGALREHDAYVKAPGASAASWRTYLLGSTGAGARAVFGLDVTNPNALGASSVRWEISAATDSDLGYVLFPIEVGVLPNGRWVALFGNGYGSGAQRAYLFVVDLETGAIEKVAVDASATSNGLGGVSVKRSSTGVIQSVYAGALNGKLWKFTVDSGGNFTVANSGAPLFTAANASSQEQAILQPPALFNHSQGGTLLTFGTGRLITESDSSNSQVQTMYGVWDKPSDSLPRPLSRTNLVARTLEEFQGTGEAADSKFYRATGNSIDWATQRGWVIDLSLSGYSGLRVVYPPQAISTRSVLFSTVVPAPPAAECQDTAGRGINFVFPVEGGSSNKGVLFDTNGDGVFDETDSAAAGYSTGADGIDAVVSGISQQARRGGSGGPEDLSCFKRSIQNSVGAVNICDPTDPPTAGSTRATDRVWRRLINPPIR
jgi:type IV pilus assembly protein PilY1